MNAAHLPAEVPTVFESLDDAGLRTAGTTYLIYRGRHAPPASKERRSRGSPRRSCAARSWARASSSTPTSTPAARRAARPLGLPGARDQHTGCVGAYLVEHDLFDFLLFSLPDNDTHSHEHGPSAQVASIAEADRQLDRLMHAGGGRRPLPRGARGHRGRRPLARARRAPDRAGGGARGGCARPRSSADGLARRRAAEADSPVPVAALGAALRAGRGAAGGAASAPRGGGAGRRGRRPRDPPRGRRRCRRRVRPGDPPLPARRRRRRARRARRLVVGRGRPGRPRRRVQDGAFAPRTTPTRSGASGRR